MSPRAIGFGLGLSHASSGAPTALPDSLANLVAWGEGSSLGADGSSIASWTNLTLSGLDPAQGTGANQPTVVANAINGQKAALFTAANLHHLRFPSGALSWFQNIPGATLAVVAQPMVAVPVTQANILTVSINASATARLAILRRPTTSVYGASIRTNDSTAVTVDTTAQSVVGTPVILATSFDALNGPIIATVNGAVSGSATANPLQNLPNTASFGIAIGATAAPSSAFDGYIAAYAMWNVPYTAAQLAPVLRRWALLYGLTLS